MKILLLSQFYWLESRFHFEEEGGVVRQLAETLAGLGHEVVVLTQSSEVQKLKKIQVGRLETWASPRDQSRNFMTGLRDRWARKTYGYGQVHSDVLALKEFLQRRGKFDVIWAHAESPDGLTVALAAQQGVKVPPMVLQVQALRVRYQNGAPVFVDKRPLGLAFRRAKLILPVSELIADNLLQYAPPGPAAAEELKAKIHVVYPNVQRAFLRAGEERPTVPGPMRDRILFLGALNQHKGAINFLRALPKTEASHRNSVFVVVGDFTEYNAKFIQRWETEKELARMQLTGARVEYLNRVSAVEVIRQIKLARAVVIPSLYDAFARGVVEALLIGRPVITTERVGASPLVRDHQCGIVMPPNDPDALARAIDIILSPVVPFTENAEHVGRRLMHEFSPESIARQIEKHLVDAIAH